MDPHRSSGSGWRIASHVEVAIGLAFPKQIVFADFQTCTNWYELYAACETVKDLDQLYSDLGMADETPDDVMRSVCDPGK